MSVQPIDLVQIKWQQIRVVEAAHVTERENIELRKKIREVQSSSARIGGEALKKFMANFKSYAIKHKLDMAKLKTYFVKDMNEALQLQLTFKAAYDKTLALLEEKEVAFMTSKAENRLQRTQLSAAKHEAQEVAKAHEAEKSKLQAKIDKLMAEKLDNQYSTERIFAEAAQKQKMYDDLLAVKNKLESQNEFYREENKRLKGVISATQIEYNESMEAMQGLLNQQKEESQSNIDRLLQDIDYLKNIITEQEEQIQRLSNQLIGNKSHFAKFVEIKSENLNLQAKLDAIMGKTSTSGSRKMRSGGPVQLPNLTHSSSNNNLTTSSSSARDSDREETVPGGGGGGGGVNPAHNLPAYQKMKSKLVIANSIMKVMGSDGEVGPADVTPGLDDAVAILNVVNKSSKSSKLVPTLPLGSNSGGGGNHGNTATTGVGYDEADYIVSQSPRGHALSADAYAHASKKHTKEGGQQSSARGAPGANIEPHLMVNFKPPAQPQQQQPRPPPVDANDTQRANGGIRKSMRVDNSVTASSPVPQVNFVPDFNPISVEANATIRIPGVPVLKSRERVVI